MAARPIVKGVDLFICRRVNGRRLRLRPSRTTNQIVRYVVAVFAKRYGVKIHAICVMSNHWHLVVHDPFGKIVDFTHDCHEFIALAVNRAHGDEGSLWNSQQTHQARCVTPTDTLGRIAYTMANPVKHGAVKFAKNWPGVRHAWPAEPKTIKRPPHYFTDAVGDDGELVWPETIELVLERPLGFDHLSDDELAAEIQRVIAAAEESFRIERAELGLGFSNRRACRRQSRWSRATKRENKRRRDRTIVCDDYERYQLELAAARAWRAEYNARLALWRAGHRDVVFPHGTYKMRLLHGVDVAPAPP